MSDENIHAGRRQFLKQSAEAVVGAGALLTGSFGTVEAQLGSTAQGSGTIPPHRELQLPGLHTYAERSIAAGETIHFRTSSTVPYRLSICRLAGDVDDQSSDVVLHTQQETEPRQQSIYPGSYVHVDQGLPADQELSAITLEGWVRPWRLNEWQGVITQHDFPQACGVGLFIDHEGQAALYLGDGGEYDRRETLLAPN